MFKSATNEICLVINYILLFVEIIEIPYFSLLKSIENIIFIGMFPDEEICTTMKKF